MAAWVQEVQDLFLLGKFAACIQSGVSALADGDVWSGNSSTAPLSQQYLTNVEWARRVDFASDAVCPMPFQVAIVMLQAAFESDDRPAICLVNPLFNGSATIPFIAAKTWIQLHLHYENEATLPSAGESTAAVAAADGPGLAALKILLTRPPAKAEPSAQRYKSMVDLFLFDAGLRRRCGAGFVAQATQCVEQLAWLSPAAKRDLIQKVRKFDADTEAEAEDGRAETAASSSGGGVTTLSDDVGSGGENAGIGTGSPPAAVDGQSSIAAAGADFPSRQLSGGDRPPLGPAWIAENLQDNWQVAGVVASAVVVAAVAIRHRKRIGGALGGALAFAGQPLVSLATEMKSLFLGSSVR